MLIWKAFLLSCIVGGLVSCQDCSDSSIVLCMGAFANSEVSTNPVPLDSPLPAWNESYNQLRDRCTLFQLYSNCMQSVIPFCNATYAKYINGINYAYQYLCQDLNGGLQTFAQYEQCYTTVPGSASFCSTSYYSKIQSLTSPLATSINAFCYYSDAFISCMQTSIGASCSDDATSWIVEWNRRLLYYIVSGSPFYCSGWSGPNDGGTAAWTIILSVVLGLTTIILIIGIIITFVIISRKRKLRRRSTLVLRPPPPYTSEAYTGCDHQELGQHEASVSLPGPNDLGHGVVSVTMLPGPVSPPPYAGKQAPDYGVIGEGVANGGFVEEEALTMNVRGLEGHEEKENVVQQSGNPIIRSADETSDRKRASEDFF